ncbi:MAG: PilZ domain-containing protein [Planctomycetes bacterium]|nr:PilZ domain-containing protein [Planctomycetota bacterium]
MGRNAARVKLVVPCEIKGSKETLKVPVRDISLDGIRLVSAESHAVGDTIKVALRLGARLELAAEIRWVEHDAAKSQYVLGCRFAHAGDSRQALKDTLTNMASAIDSAARRVK